MSHTLNVHVRVNDEAGKPTPVRIRFANASGDYYPPLGRSGEFPLGPNEDVGGQVYLKKKRYAYIDGACEVPLPTGVPLSVEITKGPAYIPVEQTITLGAGQISLRFEIQRWTDDRWNDLLATDTRCHFISPYSGKLEAVAEGLDFVHLLARVQDYPSQDGHLYRVIPNMTAFSGQFPVLAGVFVNTFNVHPVLGRLALLHSHRVVFPLTFGHLDESDDWSLSDWCDQCHRKKGLVVWCDAYRAESGLPGGEAMINAVLGKVDAVEMDALERSAAFLPFWYRLLNAGVKLPLVGGSGKESNRIALGGMRTLTPAGSYLDWVEHVRSGRTIASNAPFLRLRVNGQSFSSRIIQSEPQPLGIEVEAASIAPFEKLEVIANGEVIGTTPCERNDVSTATLKLEHRLPSGGWLAARCWGTAKPEMYPHVAVFAHTSPCFVGVSGQPAFCRPAAVQATLKEIETVRSWVETDGRFTNPRRREHLLSLCGAAKVKLSAQI